MTAVLEGPGARDERRARQVWALVCLELWAQTYVDRAGEGMADPLPPRLAGGTTAAA